MKFLERFLQLFTFDALSYIIEKELKISLVFKNILLRKDGLL